MCLGHPGEENGWAVNSSLPGVDFHPLLREKARKTLQAQRYC